MYSIQIQENFIKTDPQDVPYIKSQATVQSLFTEFVFWNIIKQQSKNIQALSKTYNNNKSSALEHSPNSKAAQTKETKPKESQAVKNNLT